LTQPLATLVIESKIQPGSVVRAILSDARDRIVFESTPVERVELPTGPTVLIVDDNQDFLRLLSLELTHETKWKVLTAQSVADAEALSAVQDIDFGLLDLLLPDGNGFDLGGSIKKRHPHAHIAIMTGAALTIQEQGECRDCEFDIVNKPFLPQQIIALALQRLRGASQARASA
jgi:DNA-binding NtrC family response regulator